MTKDNAVKLHTILRDMLLEYQKNYSNWNSDTEKEGVVYGKLLTKANDASELLLSLIDD